MIAVTRHGEQRVRGRLGLPKRAVASAAERAWREGAPVNRFAGAFRRYLDREARMAGAVLRVYGPAVYVFTPTGSLITCWPVSARYARAAARPAEPSPAAAATSGDGTHLDAPPHTSGPQSQEAGLSGGIPHTDPTPSPTSIAARGWQSQRGDIHHNDEGRT